MKCDPDTLMMVEVYSSVTLAAESIAGNKATAAKAIAKAADGQTKLYKGYAWRWKPIAKGATN